MAHMWKGTVLEPHTSILLAMLLREDGTLTAERRHDCLKGVCYAIGIQGHHICYRGTPLIYGKPHRTFCTWKNGKSPQQQFEALYPTFATQWTEQFREYTLRMTQCIESGTSINRCIQNWNSREVNRIAKVKQHVPFITFALAPQ